MSTDLTGAQVAELIPKLRRVLDEQGIVAVLRVLNGRTPHRYTGIYRFDPPTLRNVYLVDAFDPSVRKGVDVAMADAYCVIVGDQQRSIVFNDARCDPRFIQRHNSAVVSYVGVLLRSADGRAFGSLCHYDTHRCDKTGNEVSVLESIGPAIMTRLETVESDALTAVAADQS